jgi:hypothetical protein
MSRIASATRALIAAWMEIDRTAKVPDREEYNRIRRRVEELDRSPQTATGLDRVAVAVLHGLGVAGYLPENYFLND